MELCTTNEYHQTGPGTQCGVVFVTVTATDQSTGCSVSETIFLYKNYCPVLNDATGRPGGGGADLVTKVYPNPSGQGATFYYDVSAEEDFDGTVVLYDMNGRKIKELEISGQSTYTLPFNLIASGVYLIVTQTQGKLTTDRIIIE
nr:T9SS type A sorting domain-containing protein [Mesonia aestuariivivens]